ncbi:Inactive phospholipid phosphatase 7 [Daphnia magna]|uniref:Inactive phospholipid phosphatase 7 n=1 Tax=Daphnia magna TaxID=35525 RepID=A0A0P5W6L5_9CRUS|nr:Inactive phospholipid phosphatase 7 [Daphnia magna]
MRRKSKSNEQKPDVRRENTALIANNVEQDRKTNTTTGRFRNVATWDADLSKRFASFMQTEFPGVTRMFENKFMEISGNEYIWFPALAVLYLMHPLVHKQLPLNLAIAMAFDSAVILLIKALVKRRRPTAKNPDFFTAIGPDQYSFPSGHASRTTLISFVFTQINPLFSNGHLNFVTSALIWSWSISVCFSRMLNGRHYLFDVLTGAVIGLCEGSVIVSPFWMSPEQAEGLFRFLPLENGSSEAT